MVFFWCPWGFLAGAAGTMLCISPAPPTSLHGLLQKLLCFHFTYMHHSPGSESKQGVLVAFRSCKINKHLTAALGTH